MNRHADALAKLATALALPPEGELTVSLKDRRLLPSTLDLVPEQEEDEVQVSFTEVEQVEDWRKSFLDYFRHGRLPDVKESSSQFQKRMAAFAYRNDPYEINFDEKESKTRNMN